MEYARCMLIGVGVGVGGGGGGVGGGGGIPSWFSSADMS